MPTFIQLPKELQFYILQYLDVEYLSQNSEILCIRQTSKNFYNLSNSYFKQKYSIEQIACLNNTTYILLNNGDLYRCGVAGSVLEREASKYEASLMSTSYKFLKVQKNVKEVFAEIRNDLYLAYQDGMLLVLTNDNKLYGLGNTHPLGLNSIQETLPHTMHLTSIFFDGEDAKIVSQELKYNYITEFKPIAPNIEVRQAALSNNHIVLLDIEGKVYVCGFNGYGQLGIGNNNLDCFTEALINGQSFNAEKVFTTENNTFILSKDKFLYVAGKNKNMVFYNQIPDGFPVYNFLPLTRFVEEKTLKQIVDLKEDGFLYLCDNGDVQAINKYKQIVLINNIEKVVFCNSGCFFVKKDGTLFYMLIFGNERYDYFQNTYGKFSKWFYHDIPLYLLTYMHSYIPKSLMVDIVFKFLELSSNLIVEHNQISDLCCGSTYYNKSPDNNRSCSGQYLIFSKDNGQKLYSAGYNCFGGELGLPNISETKGSFLEVFDSLPVHNKLLQGRVLSCVMTNGH